MDRMAFNVLIPAFLGIVVAGMINTTCIEENTRFSHRPQKGGHSFG
jgi:hypothetical protein